MFKIINKAKLSATVTQLEIEAPLIAKKALPGQFVVVVNDEKAERVPLTLADWDASKGTIKLILQEAGFSTRKIAAGKPGDYIEHVLGPLGHPTAVEKIGRVICVAGGVGIAEILPVSSAFRKVGNYVIGIIGARSRELLILDKEMKACCDELHITTDDGSFGRKGLVTDVLKDLLVEKTNLVYAIGPVIMMRAVSELTRSPGIKTIVSLNPIMVDATGMCGSCRCTVKGEARFACVDGPDFDGHLVDFQELQERINQFKKQEQQIRDTL